MLRVILVTILLIILSLEIINSYMLMDVGGEVEADMDGSSEFGHVTLPLSSDFRRRPTQQTAPDGWYCRLQVIL